MSMLQLPLGVRLADRALFESFVAGANAGAVAHLAAVAAGRQGGTTWLAGPAGSGKSHLLQAVCARAGESGHAVYLPLRELLPLGAGALEGWSAARCLCLDDVDAVSGRREWEQALFGLQREADERGAGVLYTAHALPRLLGVTLPDLGSRWSAAVAFTLRPLDEAGQCAALQLRAQLRGLELPAATARYLQNRYRRDMGTLYGLLDTLDAAALQARRRLTVPFIRDVLERLPGDTPPDANPAG
ncbi:MAG: DnaA regulatory inactivator Hda [Gammaproteobacteria bacterium]|nr:DnaA regulatory inactivator Hda [Gammaproteobacteria bacterium]